MADPNDSAVDAAVIDCWKANYCLEETPHDLCARWEAGAPAGAVLALRVAVAELERLQARNEALAREAYTWWTAARDALAANAAAVAAEREACAKLISDIGDDWERVGDMQKVAACDYLEDTIRMRANDQDQPPP